MAVDLTELSKTYEALVSGCDQLQGLYSAQVQTIDNLKTQIATLEDEQKLLTLSSTVLSTLVKTVSVESLESIERLVSYGLRSTISDQNLRFGLEVSQKRGATYIDPYLVAGEVKGPILDAFGGGPASIIGFLLRLLVCRRLKLAPLMLLDEPFSFLSVDYVENASMLLRELAEKLGVTMILVTHQPGFLRHAHKAYQAVETSHGTVFKSIKTDSPT